MDNTKRRQLNKIFALILISISFILTTWLMYKILPFDVEWVRNGTPSAGVDWKGPFRKASLSLLAGKSPYSAGLFVSPPWVLLILMPIALFSTSLGSAIMFTVNLFAYVFVIHKMGMNKWIIIPFVLFSGMLGNSINGNIEGLIALGFLMPPTIGLFFVLMKPQIGFGVAIYWLIDEYQNKGFKSMLNVLLPVSVSFGISFVIFGFWPINASVLIDVWWNASIWPIGIPLGILLMVLAIQRREIKFAIAASPFFSPYLAGHSWAIVWLGLLSLKLPDISFISIKRNTQHN